ncbi:MAG: hypothetical protein ACRD03_02800 [Acidimicrobiales bacterium]
MTPGFDPETWARSCARSLAVAALWVVALGVAGWLIYRTVT